MKTARLLLVASTAVLPLLACGNGNAGGQAPEESDLPGAVLAEPDWNCGERCFRDLDFPAREVVLLDRAIEGESEPPKLLYPLSGSVHPANISDITFQLLKGSPAQQYFELTVAAGQTRPRFRFLFRCGPVEERSRESALECAYRPPAEYWAYVASANAGEKAAIQLRASDNGSISRSGTTPIQFSSEAVSGGFYFWSTALRGTYRLPFGADAAVPWIVPGTPTNPTQCGGCHAVSRDGNVIAFTADAAAGYLQVADAAAPEQKRISETTERNSSMLALNHDGSRVVTAYDGNLAVWDTTTGNVLARAGRGALDSEKAAYFPEFSPTGDELVVTLSDVPDSYWSVRTGEIAVVSLVGDQFAGTVVIAASETDAFFYPSWSPDSEWVLFAAAPAFSVSYDQAQARLCLVHRSGGKIYELPSATQGLGHTSTWPKFAPFVQDEGNVMFFTFNSKLDYGFLLRNSLIADNAERLPQLWLSTLDLRKLEAEEDPSSAPLWLPFQSLSQRNHLGFWTERVSCGPSSATSDGCGPGERCVAGSCRVHVR